MTHVVTEPCIRCKYTDCVTVCPVDCFYEGPNFLVIDPAECIDCALCVAECPVDAIFRDLDLPEGMDTYVGLNAELSQRWPVIIQKKPALSDAKEWRHVQDKRQYLDFGEDHMDASLPKPPETLVEYHRTPEYTADNAPASLLHDHHIKAGVWGRLVILEGQLRYCLEDGRGGSWILSPVHSAWIPPDLPHRVEFIGPVCFYVSYWR